MPKSRRCSIRPLNSLKSRGKTNFAYGPIVARRGQWRACRKASRACSRLPATAVHRGWKLNEYGLFSGKRRIAGLTEEEIYKKLGLAYIPPEMREDRGEIALAQANGLPALVTRADIRGDLHVHSDWTDGTASIEAMAKAAQAQGYQYIALTDHSRRVAMTHGLDPARLNKQSREIDRINERLRGLTTLMQISGRSLATRRARPACSAAATTVLTSL